MREIADKKIPSVSLFISGRPLIVNEEINLSESFVQFGYLEQLLRELQMLFLLIKIMK